MKTKPEIKAYKKFAAEHYEALRYICRTLNRENNLILEKYGYADAIDADCNEMSKEDWDRHHNISEALSRASHIFNALAHPEHY